MNVWVHLFSSMCKWKSTATSSGRLDLSSHVGLVNNAYQQWGNLPSTAVTLGIFNMTFHKVNWIKKLTKAQRGIIMVTCVIFRADIDFVMILMNCYLLLMLKIVIVTMKWEEPTRPWNLRSKFEMCNGRSGWPMIIFFEWILLQIPNGGWELIPNILAK